MTCSCRGSRRGHNVCMDSFHPAIEREFDREFYQRGLAISARGFIGSTGLVGPELKMFATQLRSEQRCEMEIFQRRVIGVS